MARRRSTGNIKFIGELFKLKMLTEPIMHDCVVKLLKNHDPESLECLCRLLTTIGKDLDFEKAKVTYPAVCYYTFWSRIDSYFTRSVVKIPWKGSFLFKSSNMTIMVTRTTVKHHLTYGPLSKLPKNYPLRVESVMSTHQAANKTKNNFCHDIGLICEELQHNASFVKL